MIDRLLHLLRNDPEPEAEIAPELAAAALLFETVWADHVIEQVEMDAMSAALVSQFNLSPARVTEIMQEVRDHHEDSVGVYQFTRILNDQLSQPQKLAVVRAMWQVAFADSELDAFEEHTIRRVADLLYVSHKDFIGAKLAARAQNPGS